MANTLRLRVTGRAEAFIEQLGRTEGLSEREIIAKALWLLERACSGDVAAVDADGQILYIFRIETVLAEAAHAAAPA